MNALVLLVIGYCLFIFPFAYFRHDDWLILGNSVLQLERDWSFAISPTLFFTGGEIPWFFRPFFKIFVYFFFQVFGYHYYLWLTAILAFVLGSLCFAAKTIRLLTRSDIAPAIFLILFVSSLHFHLGSISWMGEGMMNCPQLFFLTQALYFVCRALLSDRWRTRVTFHIAASLSFLLSLGFKESSIFLLVFMGTLVCVEPIFRTLPIKKRLLHLAPYGIITFVYLVMRLWIMPLNTHYFPHPNLQYFVKPGAIFVTSLGAPLAVWWLGLKMIYPHLCARFEDSLAQRWPYLLFFGLSLAPYFGHGFFSPGWLFYPGFYFLFVNSLCIEGTSWTTELTKGFQRQVGFVLFVATALPATFLLHRLGWWQWNIGQRQIKQIVQWAPAERISELVIFNCPNPRYPGAVLERVIGFHASFYQLWALQHKRDVAISIEPCSNLEPALARQPNNRLLLRWQFPEFTWLNSKQFQTN